MIDALFVLIQQLPTHEGDHSILEDPDHSHQPHQRRVPKLIAGVIVVALVVTFLLWKMV